MKIAIIGNAAGGKTYLARRLASDLNLPLHHVDSYQFTSDLRMRPFSETIEILEKIQKQNDWIIDGFGPLDIIEKRFAVADKIIFVDLPIVRHFLWGTKRQVKSLWSVRAELPAGCNEASFKHTVKLFKTIWRIHKKMRPELLRILSRTEYKPKLIHIKETSQLRVIEITD